MIDLNDYSEPIERHDLADVRERLRSSIEFWIFDFFPNLRVQPDRKAGRLADFSGRPPSGEGSCIIHLRGARAGQAYDFATGESAGPIDLIKYATGLTGQALFDEAARVAGLDRPTSKQPARAVPAKDYAAEIERILEGCEPMAGTVGAHYLSTRGLEDPQCEDLKFHPDLADYQTKRGYCAMVAIVRDYDGSRVGGIHRTYLEDDGSGKAAPGKKMLGDVAGGAVQLYPMTNDGHIGIAEGIETAIAASQIFGVPCWAALSREGLRQWRWPNDAHKITIFADCGEPGEKAARQLGELLAEEGRDYEIVMPIYGDDFNDDLKRGATAGEYQKKQPAKPFSDVALIETRIGQLTRETEYTTCLILATGNKLRIDGDMRRRAVVCTLTTGGITNIENRQHSFDPVEEVQKNRRQYVSDALTVTRAWILAGRPLPRGYKLMNSFADYDLVRGPLLWLGEADPIETSRELHESDREEEDRAEKVQALYEHFGDRRFLARDIEDDELRRKIGGFFFSADNREIGQALRDLSDAPAGDLVLREVGRTGGSRIWQVQKVKNEL